MLLWVWDDYLTVIPKALKPEGEKLMAITAKLIWDSSEGPSELLASCGLAETSAIATS